MSLLAQRIARQLARMGSSVTLCRQGQLLHFTACILPRGNGQVDSLPTSLGRTDPLTYLYRGPATGAGALVREGDRLLCNGACFLVGGLRDFHFAGQLVLRTADLTRCPPEEVDNE